MSESPAAPPPASGDQSDEHVKAKEARATAATVEDDADAADPDEDDLDDLDDMLDDFSSMNVKPGASGSGATSKTATQTAGVKSNTTAKPKEPVAGPGAGLRAGDLSEEEFQKQLEAGMAQLMGDFENNPEMKAQFDHIFNELGAAVADIEAEESDKSKASTPTTVPAPASTSAPASASASNTGPTGIPTSKPPPQTAVGDSAGGNGGNGGDSLGDSGDASFQETIRRTMARMQASGDQATAAAASGEGSEEDMLAEMMRAMGDLPGMTGAGGPSGEASGGEEGLTRMLMGLMEQLTNKEILYEPMRELHGKFPGWMETNKPKLSEPDCQRYDEQMRLVKDMVLKFEEPTYSDDNAKDREYVVERMQKMQAAGSPPPDLIGDMPSAKEIFDSPDDSCAPQ